MSWLSDLFGGGGNKNKNWYADMLRNEEELRRQQIAEAQQKEAAAQRQRDEAAAAVATKTKNAEARKGFETTARGYAGEKMKATGINDTYGLGSYYDKLLTQSLSGLPEDVNAATTINPETLYARAYGDVREGAQRNALSKVNAAVGDNYGRSQFADTADDAILDSILNTQYGSANEAVERAKSRGILNDAGYAAATKGLGETKTAARAKLEDTGLGVLERYRGSVDTEAENLRNRARNLDLTDNIDFTKALGDLSGRVSGFQGRMEGDVRSAVGDTDLFDVGALLGRAGSKQGFVNPGGSGTSSNPLLAAFVENRNLTTQNDPSKRRLVENTGAF